MGLGGQSATIGYLGIYCTERNCEKPGGPDHSVEPGSYVSELDNDNRRTATRDHLRQLDPFLAELTLNKINMESLRPFMSHRKEVDGVSNATVNRALEIVRRILHLARDEWGWLDSFPRIRMLREPKCRVRFLARQEADALLEALPAHLRPVVSYGLATGCRMGEILNLEWNRVDFDRRVAWLDHGTTKNGEGRGVPLNNDAILALRAVEGNHGAGVLRIRVSAWTANAYVSGRYDAPGAGGVLFGFSGMALLTEGRPTRWIRTARGLFCPLRGFVAALLVSNSPVGRICRTGHV